MKSFVHRCVRFASGPLLWVNIALVLAAKVLVPAAGLGLATIIAQVTTLDAMHVVDLTNQERTALGIGELVRDAKLDAAAQAKLEDMDVRDYFAHVTPDNLQPWDFVLRAGYRYQSAGENLAKGFKDAGVLVTAWMGSPSHRANIVNPAYRNIGVAVGRATLEGKETTVVVQMFAAPLAGAVQPKPVARTSATPLPTTRVAAAPVPSIQPVSTDFRIAGVELTEVAQPEAVSGRRAAAAATGMVGAYFSLVFGLLSVAFIVTGPRRHAVVAWAGHAFALLLLTILPVLDMPVSHIF